MTEEQEDTVHKMVEWFHQNYEDPVHSQPVDGGDYVWLVDQCDAREELEEHFPNADPECLDAAVTEVQAEGTFDWVRSSDLDEENFTK